MQTKYILLIVVSVVIGFTLLLERFGVNREYQAEYVCRDHGGLYMRYDDHGPAVCNDGQKFPYYSVVVPEEYIESKQRAVFEDSVVYSAIKPNHDDSIGK